MLLKRTHNEDFAIHVNITLIESLKAMDNMFSRDYEYKRLYEILITEYFNAIWPDLSQALLKDKDEYITFYNLQNIIGGGVVSLDRAVILSGDSEQIKEWCRKNELAPARLAHMVPFFSGTGIDEYSQFLLDEFGQNNDVISILDSHIHSYAWTGSLIPLYESRISVLQTLTTHKFSEVRDLAERNIAHFQKEIERQRNREAENMVR